MAAPPRRLCQINTTVGDLDGNVARVVAALAEADDQGCDLAVFPELAITGYPPEDLLLKRASSATTGGRSRPWPRPSSSCAAWSGSSTPAATCTTPPPCAPRRVQAVYHKHNLPNYAVFDEQRYFAPGTGPAPLVEVAGVRVGVSICEDAFSPTGPIAAQAAGGAELRGQHQRLALLRQPAGRARAHAGHLASDAASALVYVNQVGGQDELVFDGASMVFDAHGELLARAGQFTEETLICDVEVQPVFRKRLLDPRGRATDEPLPVVDISSAPQVDDPSDVRRPAVADPLPHVRGVRGPRDRHPRLRAQERLHRRGDRPVGRHRLVAGGGHRHRRARPEHVHGVLMPSRYSSDHSLADAEKLAVELGIEHRVIPIEPAHAAFVDMLAPSFEGREPDVTEENLQSRIRGVVMMALSNKFRGWIVLTTGNKSEMAVGYSTLYGDTAGGFAVIKDVPKLLVYELCRDRNARADRPWCPTRCSPSRRRRSCAPTSATTSRCPPTRCSIPSSRPTSRTTAPGPSWWAWGSTPRSSSASPDWSTPPSTSAARRRRACGSPRRRSARTAGCRSPTATAADRACTGLGSPDARPVSVPALERSGIRNIRPQDPPSGWAAGAASGEAVGRSAPHRPHPTRHRRRRSSRPCCSTSRAW